MLLLADIIALKIAYKIGVKSRPSQLGLSQGGPTKVRAHKSFLITKGSLQVKNKCMIM